MTTTPKSVILAVVVMLGLIALAVVGGSVALAATGNSALPDSIVVIGASAAAGMTGLLASTRTTPELPPGAQLTGGATTLTTPTTAENAGETPSGTPLTARVVDVPDPAPQPAPTGLVTLADQGIDPALGFGGGNPDQNTNAAGG